MEMHVKTVPGQLTPENDPLKKTCEHVNNNDGDSASPQLSPRWSFEETANIYDEWYMV